LFRLKACRGFEEIADVPVMGILSSRKANLMMHNFSTIQRNRHLTTALIRDFLRARPSLPEEISRFIRDYVNRPCITLPKY